MVREPDVSVAADTRVQIALGALLRGGEDPRAAHNMTLRHWITSFRWLTMEAV